MNFETEIKKSEECHESWISCKERYPEEGKTVILWRHGPKRYSIAFIENSVDENRWGTKEVSKSIKWRSHSGNALKLDDKDFWRVFPYLSVTEEYL